jgi:hypothetical protein
LKKFLPLIVIAHTLLLLLLTFLWLNLPYTYDYEFNLLSRISIFKNVVLGAETKPDSRNFLFINISYEKKLVEKLDDYGFPIGNEAITDRAHLATFFEKAAHTNGHRFIVCDVFADVPTEDDSLLVGRVKSVKNVVFPYHHIDNEFLKPVVDVPSALGDYSSDFGTFVKYSYVQHDTCASIALTMYRHINGGDFERGSMISWLNGKPALNSFIIEFPIRQYDIFTNDTTGYNSMHLQDLLSLPDSMIDATLKDRIVVVGDFLEGDRHQTMYGDTAGPLIHLNAYLSLRSEANRLTFFFLLYVFVCLLFFSVRLFYRDSFKTFDWIARLKNSKYGGFIFDYLEFALFLAIMSALSYVIFGIHLNVLVMGLYFSVVDNVIEYLRDRRTVQQ